MCSQWVGSTDNYTTSSTITVGDLIKSARYDLQDHGGQKWDDDQMVDYVNRVIQLLDRLLISQDSDFTMTHGTTTLGSGDNTVTQPTRSVSIVGLYRGTILIPKSPLINIMHLYQTNDKNSSTGPPNYWSHNGTNFYFDIEADDDYALDAYYHVKSAKLTILSYMPYDDYFNEYIREALVVMATKAKEDKKINVDILFLTMFKQAVNSMVVGRNFVKKYHNLGF